MQNGLTGFGSVLLLHFRSCSMVALLAYFPHLGVCSKVIICLIFSLLLELKLFPVSSIAAFMVLKLLSPVLR